MKKIIRLTESELTIIVRKVIKEENKTNVGLFGMRRYNLIMGFMEKELKSLNRRDPRMYHLELKPRYCDLGYERTKKRFLNDVYEELYHTPKKGGKPVWDIFDVPDEERMMPDEEAFNKFRNSIAEIFEHSFEEKFKKFYKSNCRDY